MPTDDAHDIVLRPWKRSDAADLQSAFVATPDLSTQLGGAALTAIGAAEEFIARTLVSEGSRRNWVIERDGRAVGNVGLSAIERTHDTAWAHYWLDSGARGEGLATRALASVAEWAFGEGIFRIELGHRVNNPDSCAVARRAGFDAEGVERQKLRYGEQRFDVELHARLAIDPRPPVETFALVT